VRIRSAGLLIALAAAVSGCRSVVKDPELVGQLNAADWTITSEPKNPASPEDSEKTRPPEPAKPL